MVERFMRPLALAAIFVGTMLATPVIAQDEAAPSVSQEEAAPAVNPSDIRWLLTAGGTIGFVTLGLSVAMVALIVEHLLSIRRSALMPPGLAESLHRLISDGQYQEADKKAREQPSYLSDVVSAGLQEVGLGYTAVEKAMEDAAQEQASRLYRKIEYLTMIGTIAPMLGLLGTVWGMIHAFAEFAAKASPQPADFAPSISTALVTTLVGLSVAIPALAAYSLFRGRIDEYVAETSLLAEQVFAPYKRGPEGRQKRGEAADNRGTERRPFRQSVPPVVAERESPS